MRPDIYWITVPAGRLGIMARPRSGDWLDDELRAWRQMGVDTVVSLLEATEVRELGLAPEPRMCRAHGIGFLSFPIPDRGVPASPNAAGALVATLAARVRDGGCVAIHCRAGIGRSGLIAACVLHALGVEDQFAAIAKARRVPVPDTDEQVAWLASFKRAGR